MPQPTDEHKAALLKDAVVRYILDAAAKDPKAQTDLVNSLSQAVAKALVDQRRQEFERGTSQSSNNYWSGQAPRQQQPSSSSVISDEQAALTRVVGNALDAKLKALRIEELCKKLDLYLDAAARLAVVDDAKIRPPGVHEPRNPPEPPFDNKVPPKPEASSRFDGKMMYVVAVAVAMAFLFAGACCYFGFEYGRRLPASPNQRVATSGVSGASNGPAPPPQRQPETTTQDPASGVLNLSYSDNGEPASSSSNGGSAFTASSTDGIGRAQDVWQAAQRRTVRVTGSLPQPVSKLANCAKPVPSCTPRDEVASMQLAVKALIHQIVDDDKEKKIPLSDRKLAPDDLDQMTRWLAGHCTSEGVKAEEWRQQLHLDELRGDPAAQVADPKLLPNLKSGFDHLRKIPDECLHSVGESQP